MADRTFIVYGKVINSDVYVRNILMVKNATLVKYLYSDIPYILKNNDC